MSTEETPHQTNELESLRAEIDRIDLDLVTLIAERVRTAQRCGGAKSVAHLALIDVAREAAVVRRAAENARACGLDPEPVRDIFWRLIEQSRSAQLATPGPGGS